MSCAVQAHDAFGVIRVMLHHGAFGQDPVQAKVFAKSAASPLCQKMPPKPPESFRL